MGQAKVRRKLAADGLTVTAPRYFEPLTILLEKESHKAIEDARAHLGVQDRGEFGVLLLGIGMGGVTCDGFTPTFLAYCADVEKQSNGNAEGSIQEFSKIVFDAGLKTLGMIQRARERAAQDQQKSAGEAEAAMANDADLAGKVEEPATAPEAESA